MATHTLAIGDIVRVPCQYETWHGTINGSYDNHMGGDYRGGVVLDPLQVGKVISIQGDTVSVLVTLPRTWAERYSACYSAMIDGRDSVPDGTLDYTVEVSVPLRDVQIQVKISEKRRDYYALDNLPDSFNVGDIVRFNVGSNSHTGVIIEVLTPDGTPAHMAQYRVKRDTGRGLEYTIGASAVYSPDAPKRPGGRPKGT